MTSTYKVGDLIRLISIPEWLTHDLPLDEQQEIRSFLGRKAQIESIDASGYLWIGFGHSRDMGEDSYYSGHSLCVPRECVELVN